MKQYFQNSNITRRIVAFTNRKLLPLSCILYFLSVVWILLFPAISISSGELKPRGLFVDENALSTHSILPTYVPWNRHMLLMKRDHSDYCSSRVEINRKSCKSRSFKINHRSYNVMELIVDSKFSPKSLESTLLIMTYSQSNSEIVSSIHGIARHIEETLRSAQWLAKRVVLLHIPAATESNNDSSLNNLLLNEWLTFHGLFVANLLYSTMPRPSERSTNHHDDDITDLGMIRDAYILDLTAVQSALRFESLTLHHMGRDGILPNMDMVSYPLALFESGGGEYMGPAPLLQSASDAGMLDRVYKRLQSQTDDTYDKCTSNDVTVCDGSMLYTKLYNNMLKVALHLIDEYTSVLFTRAYCQRLSGLLSTMYGSIVPHGYGGTGGGLHSQLLDLNIDAISLRAVPPPADLSITLSQRNLKVNSGAPSTSRGRNRGVQQQHQERTYGEETLVNMLLKLVYVSSNLHEELHHSYFYYLLMGSGHFVGITEYGLTALLILASVLILYLRAAQSCHLALLPAALLAVVLDLAPVVVCLAVAAQALLGERPPASMALVTSNAAWSVSVVRIIVPSVFGRHYSIVKGSAKRVAPITAPIPAPVSVSERSTQGACTTVPTMDCDEEATTTTTTVYLFLLICILAWVLAHHFALGAVLYLVTMPSVICTCACMKVADDERSAYGTTVLLYIALLHSPASVSYVASISGLRYVSGDAGSFATLIIGHCVVSFVALRAVLRRLL